MGLRDPLPGSVSWITRTLSATASEPSQSQLPGTSPATCCWSSTTRIAWSCRASVALRNRPRWRAQRRWLPASTGWSGLVETLAFWQTKRLFSSAAIRSVRLRRRDAVAGHTGKNRSIRLRCVPTVSFLPSLSKFQTGMPETLPALGVLWATSDSQKMVWLYGRRLRLAPTTLIRSRTRALMVSPWSRKTGAALSSAGQAARPARRPNRPQSVDRLLITNYRRERRKRCDEWTERQPQSRSGMQRFDSALTGYAQRERALVPSAERLRNGTACGLSSPASALNKRRHISRKALRLLPMEPVSGVLVHDQPSTRDCAKQRLLIGTGTEHIPRSPENQRGRLDLAKFAHEIVFQKACESGPPNMRGNFQALLYGGVEERFWYRLRSVLCWNSRAKLGSIGSVSGAIAVSQNSTMVGLPR